MALQRYYSELYKTLTSIQEEATNLTSNKLKVYDADIGECLTLFLTVGLANFDFYFRQFSKANFLPNDSETERQFLYELIGYKTPYFKSDEIVLRLHWTSCGIEEYLVIPKYTTLTASTNDKTYQFVVKYDYIIPPLTSQYLITLSQGIYTETQVDIDDVVDNKLLITEHDIDFDLVSVVISGVEWEQVRNVFYESSKGRKYHLEKESTGVYLYFDESWKNFVDTYNSVFMIYYVLPDLDFSIYNEDCLLFKFDNPLLNQDGEEVEYGDFFSINVADTASDMDPVTELFKDHRAITARDFKRILLEQPEVDLVSVYDWDKIDLVYYDWDLFAQRNLSPDHKDYTNFRAGGYALEPFRAYIFAISLRKNNFQLSRQNRARMKKLLLASSDYECLDLDVDFYDVELVNTKLIVHLDINTTNKIKTFVEKEVTNFVIQTLKSFFALGKIDIGQTADIEKVRSKIYRCDSRISYNEVIMTMTQVHNTGLDIHKVYPWQVHHLANVIVKYDVNSKEIQDGGTTYIENASVITADNKFPAGYIFTSEITGKTFDFSGMDHLQFIDYIAKSGLSFNDIQDLVSELTDMTKFFTPEVMNSIQLLINAYALGKVNVSSIPDDNSVRYKWGYTTLFNSGYSEEKVNQLTEAYIRFYNLYDKTNTTSYIYNDYEKEKLYEVEECVLELNVPVPDGSNILTYKLNNLLVYLGDLHLSDDEVNYIQRLVLADCPELLPKYVYTQDGELDGLEISGFKMTTHTVSNTIDSDIKYNYVGYYCIPFFTKEEKQFLKSVINSSFNEIKNKLNEVYGITYFEGTFLEKSGHYTLQDKRRIGKVIHDWLVLNNDYFDEATVDTSSQFYKLLPALSHSIFPALSKGIIDPNDISYSLAFSYLCWMFGINAIYVEGQTFYDTVGGGKIYNQHSWNMANYETAITPLDTDYEGTETSKSMWQEIDVSFDDPDGSPDDYCSWQYFNRNTQYFTMTNHLKSLYTDEYGSYKMYPVKGDCQATSNGYLNSLSSDHRNTILTPTAERYGGF